MKALILAAALAALALSARAETPAVPATPPAAAPAADPYLYMEEIEGQRALSWVEAQNKRSLAILKGDARYEPFHQDALRIVNATDRIPLPGLIGKAVFNFWQDPTNVHGLWRRTTAASYATANPVWETVIDLDALSRDEKTNWVWEGAVCPPPTYDRCIVVLSNGGEDATVLREFDLKTKRFVEGGFSLPRSKQDLAWLDRDTVLVTRDWGPGTMTESGYGFVLKTLKRGQALTDAQEVFRGKPTDVSVSTSVMHDAGRRAVMIYRGVSFFETETYIWTPHGVVRTPLPLKSNVQAFVGGDLIVTLDQNWTAPGTGQAIGQGSVIAVNFDDLEAGRTPRIQVLLTPTARQSVDQVNVSHGRVIVALYDNVRGSLLSFGLDGGRWTPRRLPVAENASVGIVAASDLDDTVYFSVESFLNPTRLYQTNDAGAEPREVKALPARFDATGDTVDQYEATSSDGTKVPYFVVHPKSMKLDGSNPTLLYAYGGFQVSELPTYSASIGKLWLEKGGVYVLANIRGGGEFGPAWHDAGLKTHRQLIYDDFAAVAKDLIARNITSPRRLGIQGGSNGGLLMGVEFTQHPELWRAVDIQVPLLDMVRFEKIGAGASWVGEYGSMANPDEAAFLRGISPVHNLKAGVAYPEPFFVTSTQDDRVTPVHARKMAAEMEAMGLPFLYFENTAGGHAASANLQERAERVALEFTYLTRKLMD